MISIILLLIAIIVFAEISLAMEENEEDILEKIRRGRK